MTEPVTALQSPATGNRSTTGATVLLTLSAPPHVHSGATTSRFMLLFLLALSPATIMAAVNYGMDAAAFIAVTVAATIAADTLLLIAGGKNIRSIDGSAAVTGLLLALSCPAGLPLWIGAAGGSFATLVVKTACGGPGRNFLNPALAGRALLLLFFPLLFSPAAVHEPLNFSQPAADLLYTIFISHPSSWIGGASPLAIVVGAFVARYFRLCDLTVPLVFLFSAATILLCSHGTDLIFSLSPLFQTIDTMLSGGLLIATFFMATDPATSPTATKARILFGSGCGILYALFCLRGFPADAPMHAVLIMNCLVPLIDRSMPGHFFARKQPPRGADRHE